MGHRPRRWSASVEFGAHFWGHNGWKILHPARGIRCFLPPSLRLRKAVTKRARKHRRAREERSGKTPDETRVTAQGLRKSMSGIVRFASVNLETLRRGVPRDVMQCSQVERQKIALQKEAQQKDDEIRRLKEQLRRQKNENETRSLPSSHPSRPTLPPPKLQS